MTADGCPVSWLALEQRALGELGPAEQARVDAHLAGCDRCRARVERIVGDVRPMPPVAVPRRRWVGPSVAGLLLAAMALLFAVGWPDGGGGPSVKGDTVALVVVRERAGTVVEDPGDFRAGDRFRLLLTCPPDQRVLDIAVFQGDEVSYPLERPFRCGNRAPIPGAFRLTGDLPVEVCAIPESEVPSGCVTLVPAREQR